MDGGMARRNLLNIKIVLWPGSRRSNRVTSKKRVTKGLCSAVTNCK